MHGIPEELLRLLRIEDVERGRQVEKLVESGRVTVRRERVNVDPHQGLTNGGAWTPRPVISVRRSLGPDTDGPGARVAQF